MTAKLSTHDQLMMPFPVTKIHWRIGATNRDKTQGIALAYLDARDVMYRFDSVIGPFGWQVTYSQPGPNGIICNIGLLHEGNWIWKANGAGETKVEAEKGGMSDAFKRAAVLHGPGRYLYSLPNTWVPLENSGRKLSRHPELPKWATPDGYTEIITKRANQ